MANADTDSSGGGIWESIKTIVYALLIAGVIRTLMFQPFYVPTGSMKPTILINDFTIVNKFAYGYSRFSCPFGICPFSGRIFASEPERGDVIVFRHPTRNQDYVKRLIGLPGDLVQVLNGQLIINGTLVPQEPAGVFAEPNIVQTTAPPACARVSPGGAVCEKDAYTETLPNGVSYTVLNVRDGTESDNWGPFEVPEGEYLFIGDNRDNSLDGRAQPDRRGVGFVPQEFLIGRAEIVLFSSGGSSLFQFWTWRSDRFFHWVN